MGKPQIHIEKKFSNLLALIIVISSIAISCNAPRENPVDPNNSDNKLSSINGVIKTQGYPFAPIKNVNVFWKNDNILVKTDENGKYNMPSVIRNNGWLKFECEEYSSDSTFIIWDGNNKISNEIFLNSIPKLDSLEFFSVVENRYQSSKKSLIRVRARVSDYEGANDIVSVFIKNKELNFSKTLTFDHTQDFYEGTLTLSELKINSLNEIIGLDFIILVNDLEARVFDVGVANIKRIINEEIELIAPLNNELVTELIKLNWFRYTPGYNFTYKIEIRTNETAPILVYSKSNISADTITHTITSEFEDGNYFWVIWAIDEFNNHGSSKPGSFIIGN